MPKRARARAGRTRFPVRSGNGRFPVPTMPAASPTRAAEGRGAEAEPQPTRGATRTRAQAGGRARGAWRARRLPLPRREHVGTFPHGPQRGGSRFNRERGATDKVLCETPNYPYPHVLCGAKNDPMAVLGDWPQAMAAVAGAEFPAASLKLIARNLREAGDDLVPTSGRGGGRSARHLSARHLANLTLALGAPSPVDAVRAVRTLHQLRRTARTVVVRHPSQAEPLSSALIGKVEDHRAPDSRVLGEHLKNLIAVNADPHLRGPWSLNWQGLELTLCLAPAHAQLSRRAPDGSIWTDHFQAPDDALPFAHQVLDGTEKRPGRRLTVLPHDVLVAAGELLEDTLFRCGLVPASTGQKDESAGSSPARDEPTPPTDCDPDRANDPADCDRDRTSDRGTRPDPEATAGAEGAQANIFPRDLGHSPIQPGSLRHDRRDRRTEHPSAP